MNHQVSLLLITDLIAEKSDLLSLVRENSFSGIQLHEIESNEKLLSSDNVLFVFEYSENTEAHIVHIKNQLKQKKICNPYFIIISDCEVTLQKSTSVSVYSKLDFIQGIHVLLPLIVEKIIYIARIDDYIQKSFKIIVNNEIIAQQKSEIEMLYSELEVLSKIDHLTGVLNRRAFFDSLEGERKRALRDLWRISKFANSEDDVIEDGVSTQFEIFNHLGNFSCIMLDIDFFKKINDTYGHLVGDRVLKRIGELLNKNGIFRDNDIIGRFGGEEFVVILPQTNSVDALIPAERLRKIIKNEVFYDLSGNQFSITISMGISEFYIGDNKPEDIVERADKALYTAKETGRDKIVIYKPS
ncbi:MAG: hypothetical protein A2015_08010 [Spirochaetes bacterium GWF1_31_7]|nr:MAG: hypothetical protein A2Y30_02100 [Spirochaetes bacterium GWE1_32_154]OHD46984.1 MAG: hypothetical protein A2015_08010 [Spirochaetes bacterium GWF1_31_7]OHD49764.1 MAG: hypothetical protein A2Y29_06210 [Spirochaetes bacterium GWE2_31_10]OHD77823.1 MAG: hypothetical protein A2355_09275 [Spirochaetes bacterium RIFOXYB1_FULL_32_8]